MPVIPNEPVKLNKDFANYLVLKSRFGTGEQIDKKTIFKRKEDLLRDLNLDLLDGKITKGTYFFDDEKLKVSEDGVLENIDKHEERRHKRREAQIEIIKALECEPNSRDIEQCKAIEPLVRDMKLFRPYSEFKFEDLQSIFQEMKLHKVRKGTRL